MAGIAVSALTKGKMFHRTGTAQANTGQTDWLAVPEWATAIYVDFNLTAVGGNTPLADLSFKVPDLTTMDDTTGVVNILSSANLTQLTAAARVMAQIGKNVTGVGDDVTNAATGTSNISINAVLPPYIGIKLLFDRTTGDEVYTYTLSVSFLR